MSNTGRCRHLIIFCGRLQRPVSDRQTAFKGGFFVVEIEL
jgi:hypothetical protein